MALHWGVARLAAIVYFVQGALGIAGVALPLYLRAQDFSIAKIAFITSISTAPWFFKIIYGAISDAIPIAGFRRKSYLIICSVLSCVGWFLLGVLPPREGFLIFSMTLASLGVAATDVITDGLVVEHSVEGTAQTYQGISWGFRSVGSVIAGVTGGFLAARFSASFVFLLTGMLPIISLIAAFFVTEERVDRSEVHNNIFIPIGRSLKYLVHGDFKWYLLILFLGSCGAAIGTPFFFYLREQLEFDELFLGLLSSIGWVGAIVGCFIFLFLSRTLSLKKTLYIAFALAFADVLCALLVRTHVSAFAITLFTGVLSYLTLLPLLSGAAKLTHGTGVEGSLFAVLASVYNIGIALSGFLGGLLFELIGLTALIVITAFVVFSGLLVIPRLRAI